MHHVSWRYYIHRGTAPENIPSTTAEIWDPLPSFTDVRRDGQTSNVTDVSHFLAAARGGHLANVSWVVPDETHSEHAPATPAAGERYVTRLIDSVMNGPDWDSTAIFLTWDDWGGFYDHVAPPTVDGNGYGMRVPATRDQPLRAPRPHRPPGRCPSTPSTSSSRTTSSAASGSTRGPTAAPTPAPTSARTRRSSATWRRTSTSTAAAHRRTRCRSTRRRAPRADRKVT